MSTFWDRWARFYDLVERSNSRVNAMAAARVEALVPCGATVLDCAAGTGEFSLAAAKKAAWVLSADLSPAMLAQGERKARRQGLTNISFVLRDVTALTDRDGAFDVAMAANVLHLLPQPEQAVRELWRVTAPGGRLILPKSSQGVGFHYEHAFTPESYRGFLEGLRLGRVELEVIRGRVPEGIAVIEKPR